MGACLGCCLGKGAAPLPEPVFLNHEFAEAATIKEWCDLQPATDNVYEDDAGSGEGYWVVENEISDTDSAPTSVVSI